MDSPRAVVREIDGQLVLDDPDALAVIQAMNAHNRSQAMTACRETLRMHQDRVAHFKRRVIELGKTPKEVVIVVLNVDDPYGGPIADALMPGHNWQEIRDRGEVPFARGLADREFIQGILEQFDEEAARMLKHLTCITVVVVNHGVACVFEA